MWGLTQTPPIRGRVSGGIVGCLLALVPGKWQSGAGPQQLPGSGHTQLPLSRFTLSSEPLRKISICPWPKSRTGNGQVLCPLSTTCPQKNGFAPRVGPAALITGHQPPTGGTATASSGLSLPSCPSYSQSSMAQPGGPFKTPDHTTGPASLLPLL